MSYELKLEPGERIIFQDEIPEDELGEPYAFAVTDRALYFPHKKWFAAYDPYVMLRLPLSELREVRVRGVRSLGLALAGILLAGFGLSIVAAAGLERFDDMTLGLHVGTMGLAILAGVFGRRRLVATTVTGRHAWRRPLYAKRRGRVLLQDSFVRAVEACMRMGIYVPTNVGHN